MLISSQREMVFLQSKSFFLCIDPLVQLEFPEEQHKLKKKKKGWGGGKGKKNMEPWSGPEAINSDQEQAMY